RRDLIAVAARTARHGRGHLTLHLPEAWHREQEWLNLWDAAADRPRQRPDQPRTGQHSDGPRGHPEPRPRARNPGQAVQQASGRTPAPRISSRNSSCRNQARNGLPELAGGSRLRLSRYEVVQPEIRRYSYLFKRCTPIALDGIHLDPAAGSFTYSYRPSSDRIFYVDA